MESTQKLSMPITTSITYDTDDIKTTITEYGENFRKLEKATLDSTAGLGNLIVGKVYEKGKRLWNDTLLVNGYIGWINIREGKYSPKWKAEINYGIDDLVIPNDDNGNVYRCIAEGKSIKSEPVFQVGNGLEFYEPSDIRWEPAHNYNVGNIIFPTDGGKVFYYICETSGLSSEMEPQWNSANAGSTLIDGTVTWRKEKTVKWKQDSTSCNFRPFGKIE